MSFGLYLWQLLALCCAESQLLSAISVLPFPISLPLFPLNKTHVWNLSELNHHLFPTSVEVLFHQIHKLMPEGAQFIMVLTTVFNPEQWPQISAFLLRRGGEVRVTIYLQVESVDIQQTSARSPPRSGSSCPTGRSGPIIVLNPLCRLGPVSQNGRIQLREVRQLRVYPPV